MSEPTRADTDVIGKRILAQIIDLVAMALVAVGIASIGQVLGATGGESTSNAIALFVVLLVFIGVSAYNIVLEAYWNGQTFGKRLVGIKAVNEDGSPLSLADSTVRNLPGILNLGFLSYVVALVSIAMSDTRQRMFDRLAGTVVIKE